MSLIDRVFCITSFDQNFPLAKISALPKNPSDHTPILWESGDSQDSGQPRFKFEKWWLQQEGLEEIVKNTQLSIPASENPIEPGRGKIEN